MPTLSASVMPSAPPAIGQMITAEEFEARYNGQRVELIDGIVRELPMAGLNHGKICMRVGGLLLAHVDANNLGHVISNDSWVRTGQARYRGADVLFFFYERLPKDAPVPVGAHTIAPDLVIEVKSPTDRWLDLFEKVGEYLKAGVRVVVAIDPDTRTASVYRPDEMQTIHHENDTLTLPDVLPGFSVSVAQLFG